MHNVRNIIKIDRDKCNGCGLCVNACVEGAIKLINGKATLISEAYCDGLGACLPACPTNAITIEQREAHPFDENAVAAHLKRKKQTNTPSELPCGCPGTMAQTLQPAIGCHAQALLEHVDNEVIPSQLANWPVQLKLVSPQASYFQNADLLLVADCVPFALADFHQRFLRGKLVVMGCPKLDDAGYYADKLTDILRFNNINSLTVIHMQVPCCSGLVRIAQHALAQSDSEITVRDVTIGIDGSIINEEDFNRLRRHPNGICV